MEHLRSASRLLDHPSGVWSKRQPSTRIQSASRQLSKHWSDLVMLTAAQSGRACHKQPAEYLVVRNPSIAQKEGAAN